MKFHFRAYLRSALLGSILIGLLLTVYCEFRRSRTPVLPSVPIEIVHLVDVWREEKALLQEGDRETIALAAFKIAQATGIPEWSSEAIRQYQAAILASPNNAELLAYLGAANALAARDYPISPALQVFIGPGFVRLFYVWRAVHFLNKAVAMEADDPRVRLIRGATFMGLPRIFNQHKRGRSDLQLLKSWLDTPQGTYESILKARSFREAALSTICRVDFAPASSVYNKTFTVCPEEARSAVSKGERSTHLLGVQ